MVVNLVDFAATVAGAVTYWCYFHRAEHHLHGLLYLQIFIALFVTAVLWLVNAGAPFGQTFIRISSIAGCYLCGVYLSLITYRVFFTPLRKFPGPFGAGVSNFWFSWRLKNADAHRQILKLHEKYGDFVRIGSSDLSIVHPKAISVIYGLGSKCTKANWYDLTYPMVSMQTTRHRDLHDQRRRIWSLAFSDKALRGYEDRVKRYRDQMIAQIDTSNGQPINVTKWFNLFSFDVMGDLAFGASFNMLETSEEHWAIKLLNSGMEPLGWMFPTWFFVMLVGVPGLANDWRRLIKYCSQKLDDRMAMTVAVPDIMSVLLEPWKDRRPTGADLNMLQGDSQLIVVAGSDTTASSLTYVFYELVRAPDHIQKLRDEIAPYYTIGGDVPHQQIQYLEHLNGVIYETLRLHPPVPTALQRNTPPEGIKIGHTYIPGNTTVWCPQYVIGRRENIYTNAEAFIPQRWYSRPELVKEKSAFAPFSTGTYGCIGRPLALLNIRTTLAKLIMEYDVAFAPGEDGTKVEADTRVRFTAGPGELKLVFRKREIYCKGQ
ncbi:MAG: hypothetical protein Q9187_001416 [Circinaria calcarea]